MEAPSPFRHSRQRCGREDRWLSSARILAGARECEPGEEAERSQERKVLRLVGGRRRRGYGEKRAFPCARGGSVEREEGGSFRCGPDPGLRSARRKSPAKRHKRHVAASRPHAKDLTFSNGRERERTAARTCHAEDRGFEFFIRFVNLLENDELLSRADLERSEAP